MRATALALSLVITASCAALFAGCSGSTTRAQQTTPAPPVIEFLGAWGTKGNGPGILDDPRSIATDDFAAVYIADMGKPDRFVNKFTRGGHPLQSFTPLAKFQDPCASAVDRGGMIYVLDCSTGVLYTFLLQEATIQRSIHTVPAKQKPVSFAVSDDGSIYIASREAPVTKFTPRGGRIGSLGKSLKEGLVFADQVAAAPDNTIYAVRCTQPFIEQLASDSSTVNQWVRNTAVSGAADNDTCFLAATQKYIALLANVPSAPVLRIFAVAEKHEKLSKLLSEIDPSLTNLNIKGMAATQDGELLILDAAAPRVLRFRLN
jgi:DNA-binding beta-propeller fold protein YncE